MKIKKEVLTNGPRYRSIFDRQTDRQTDVILSIIIPVYNLQEYIGRCLDSCINQTIPNGSYEIICVNDGSTDNSLAIINEYYRKDERIKKIDQKNRGVSAARNTGLSFARGKYVWFVDGDDMLIQNSAEILLEFAERYNADVIIGDYMHVDESAILMQKSFNTRAISVTQPTLTDLTWIEKDTKPMQSCCRGVFRKSFLIDNGIYFHENVCFKEDALFYFEFVQSNPQLYRCDAVVYCYRDRKSSIMNTRTDERNKKLIESSEALISIYSSMLNKLDGKYYLLAKERIEKETVDLFTGLVRIRDTAWVKLKMKELKCKKLYPYHISKKTNLNDAKIVQLITMLLPVELAFWCFHIIYRLRK